MISMQMALVLPEKRKRMPIHKTALKCAQALRIQATIKTSLSKTKAKTHTSSRILKIEMMDQQHLRKAKVIMEHQVTSEELNRDLLIREEDFLEMIKTVGKARRLDSPPQPRALLLVTILVLNRILANRRS